MTQSHFNDTGTPGVSIEIEGLSRRFDTGFTAIDRLTLRIEPSQFVALLGPSGCGKTTLLRIIAGLDRPDRGKIHVDCGGRQPAGTCESIAYVFQDPHLMPWRSVLANVALPLELRGQGKAERLEAARHAIAQVGLADAARLYPNQLSGGMRMRVSLARALVTWPKLLLLDEPFAALDELTRQRLDEQLRALWLERRMTTLFVTHSIAEAAFLAERAIVFTPRPARIIADHAIQYITPRTARLRGEAEYAVQMRHLHEALEHGEMMEAAASGAGGHSQRGGER